LPLASSSEPISHLAQRFVTIPATEAISTTQAKIGWHREIFDRLFYFCGCVERQPYAGIKTNGYVPMATCLILPQGVRLERVIRKSSQYFKVTF
jgi:hypothetical protein